MIELAFFLLIITLVWRRIRYLPSAAPQAAQPSPKLTQLSQYADRMYAQKKWVAAEKAYLDVLKLDHRNVTAYSHLGIIYSTQKHYDDAIECFQIPAQIRPSAGTYQNLGLVYYENKNYIKSIAAMEKAIMFEPSAPRYIAISKSYRKLSDRARTINALEKAVQLDPSERIVQLLVTAYTEAGRPEDAELVKQRMAAVTATTLTPKSANPKTA